MTVFIAKISSRFSLLPQFEYGPYFSSRTKILSFASRFMPAREFISSAFLAIILISASAYIVGINLIILNGRKIPALEAKLELLRNEQKLMKASAAASYSPVLIKKEAIEKIQMVEVKDVKYISETEEVASNIIPIP